MNVNQLIEHALGTVTDDIWPLCCPGDSQPEKYIVYNPELEKPGLHADDSDQDWIAYMQVHLYTKSNYIDDKKKIKKNLQSAGFTLTSIDTLYEKDSGYIHLCFSCYIEEE